VTTQRLRRSRPSSRVTEPKTEDEFRLLQIRFWTEEKGWNYLVIDPKGPGVVGTVPVGYGRTETESSADGPQARGDGYGLDHKPTPAC
jgi:hypothetical protein